MTISTDLSNFSTISTHPTVSGARTISTQPVFSCFVSRSGSPPSPPTLCDVMGNCQKSRLCDFLHDHCNFLFFGRYQSIFESSESAQSTFVNGVEYTQCSGSAKVDCAGSSAPYLSSPLLEGGPTVGSSASRYAKNCPIVSVPPPSSNLAGSSSAGGSSSGSRTAAQQERMNRQRSASHCPHQLRPDAESKSPAGRKCCCPGSGGSSGKGGSKGSKGGGAGGEPSPTEHVGRSKRASSLRILNKRFHFPFNDSSAKEAAAKAERRTSNASSSAAQALRQPTSATYHHGSSANHQIIYHSTILSRNSRKAKHHHLKLNELDDRSLLHVFEYLTLKERAYFERVCRRWQSLIRTSLLAPASLKIGEHSVKCNCTCAYFPSWDLPPVKKFPRDSAGYIVYPNSLLRYLLSMCRKLKCINFSHCYLDDQALQVRPL